MRKTAIIAGASVGLAFAAIAFAHTPMGRPLLGWLRGAPGCPVLNASPAKVEAFRVSELEAHRGDHKAAATPALAFTLGTTTRADVDAWVAAGAASCASERGDSALRCKRVDSESTAAPRPAPGAPSPEGAPIEDLFLQFDPSGRLVALDAFRHARTSDAAVGYLKALAAYLEKTVGPATKSGDEPTAAYLDAHPYGRGGMRVREQYQWLPPESK